MSDRPRHDEFWNEHTKDLDGDDKDPAQYGTVTQQAAVVRLRDRLERAHMARAVTLRGDERVLDLGGGAGRIALWLAPKVAHVTLIDASAELLGVAERRAAREGIGNVSFVHASATEVELAEDRYDLVVVSGLLTHLPDDEVEALVEKIARSMSGPRARLLLKEPVSTDGRLRVDERRDDAGKLLYVARFRPREDYPRRFGKTLPLLYQRATVSHPIPFFMGGTEEAAEQTGSETASVWLDRIAPLWERIDPWLLDVEQIVRETPGLDRLLAPVPVLQDLYVFGAPLREQDASRAVELSVVVIAFDEEECLESVVEELVQHLSLEGLEFELVLVDDGSSDRTLEIMERMRARDGRLRVVPLSPNRGIGGALRAGFDAARGSSVTWVPADGQISPETVSVLYRRRGEAPMLTTVYEARDDALYRHVISQTLNTMIRLKTGQRAVSGGNYLFDRAMWEQHAPRDDDTMMISTAFRKNLTEAGVPIAQVAIRARARVAGRSKVLNSRTILRTLGATLSMSRRAP